MHDWHGDLVLGQAVPATRRLIIGIRIPGESVTKYQATYTHLHLEGRQISEYFIFQMSSLFCSESANSGDCLLEN